MSVDFSKPIHMGRGLPRLPLGTIYYIACTETQRLKIGFTGGSVEKRLKSLQTGAAGKLMVIASNPGTRDDEAALHTFFASQRLHGEWFEMDEALFDHVCEVVWVAAHIAAKDGASVPAWMPLGLHMLEQHTGVELPAEIRVLM